MQISIIQYAKRSGTTREAIIKRIDRGLIVPCYDENILNQHGNPLILIDTKVYPPQRLNKKHKNGSKRDFRKDKKLR